MSNNYREQLKEHLQLLKRLGYMEGVHPNSVPSMNGDEIEAQQAIASYQEMWSEELDTFTATDHGRTSVPDGEYGPSTNKLLNLPRCGYPDILPFRDREVESAIPDSCRFAITTSYKPGMTLPGLDADTWKKVWIESNKNLMDAVECTLTFNPDQYPDTIFYAFLARLGGSVLADHMLGNDCSPHRGRYDSDRRWNEGLAVAVASHEKVHGLGVGHTNASGALMNPFIHNQSISRRGKLIDADIKMLERVGYKRRTGPIPNPEPGANKFLTGEVKLHNEDGTTTNFIISGKEV